MILLIALRVRVSSEAPWNSGGYSIEPTPMIAPWPFISRGTEWLVPIVPGLVRLIVVPWKSRDRELVVAGLADQLLVRRPEVREVHRLGGLDRGHQQLPGAVGLGQVDGQAEVDVGRRDQVGLAVDRVEADVHLGHRPQRLDQREADQVRERHLAAAGAGEVVVDHDPVVPEQLDRHRADAGRGGDGQRDVHVLHGAGGGAAEHGVRSARRSPRTSAAAAGPWPRSTSGSRSRARSWCSSPSASFLGLRLRLGLARLGLPRLGLLGRSSRRSSPVPAPGASASLLRAFWGRSRGPAPRLLGLRRGGLPARAVVAAGGAVATLVHALKKSHQALSTLFGSRWYCSYISSTSHSLAPNASSTLLDGGVESEDSGTTGLASSGGHGCGG